MASEKEHALLWNKYMELNDENEAQKLIILERDETIALLRRELVNVKNKVARLEQILSPDIFLASR